MTQLPDQNPFAPPSFHDVPLAVSLEQTYGGVWRSNNLIVMHKSATLPDRCIKSNEPTNRKLRRELMWHHPAVYAAILANILIYAILAMILRKKATVHIGLSDEWFAKRRRTIITAWTLSLAGVGAIAVAIGAMRNDFAGFVILGGVVLTFGAIIYGLIASRMVVATKIDDNYVWIKGAKAPFLDTLPVWPFPS